MLVIRAEQMGRFEALALDAFEMELAEHLHAFEPGLCRAAGEEGLAAAVKLGVRRAREHGFTTRGSLCFYVELMCVLGSDFDTDPQLYWAGETLGDPSIEGEVERGNWLYDRMTVYLDEVAGPGNANALAALRRLQRIDLQREAHNTAMTEDSIVQTMASVFPEKATFVGEQILRTIVRQSGTEAAGFALPSPGGAATLAGLKFALGHGVCHDPLYPWIGATLSDPRTVDGEARLKRLLKKIGTYLDSAMAYLNG